MGPQPHLRAPDDLEALRGCTCCDELLGLERAKVERLLLIADFPAIELQPEVEAALQRLVSHPLRWTLVDAPSAGNQLTIEALAEAAGKGDANPYRDLQRIAAGIVDELETPQHIHQRIHFSG